ncbi:MTH1187 family thiamine-binding protein [Halovivax sp.]|uniref:MTH1187 family thiamine-binding protein n=1 Tax=Halovivax sp. TaxID=1935978 RepID=UPI0025BA244B|nr:MTH1187 family thiamine-binding protein [Halovivax sp.]
MTVIGFLSTAPVSDEPMSDQVASAVEAIDETGVTYQTGPMGTTIEAESIDELLEAVRAAHEAIDADRVSTVLKIDDRRDTDKGAWEKVETVEESLGRPATNRDQQLGRPAPDHDD